VDLLSGLFYYLIE